MRLITLIIVVSLAGGQVKFSQLKVKPACVTITPQAVVITPIK